MPGDISWHSPFLIGQACQQKKTRCNGAKPKCQSCVVFDPPGIEFLNIQRTNAECRYRRATARPQKRRTVEENFEIISAKLDMIQRLAQASVNSTGSGPFNTTPPEPSSGQRYQQEEALGTHPVLTVNRENEQTRNVVAKSLNARFMCPFLFPISPRDEGGEKEPAYIVPTILPIPDIGFSDIDKIK
jgi:hypothetical protein